jgi:uncharacterized protein YcbK (DUF882 family)
MFTPDPTYGWFKPSETMSKDGAKGDIKDELRDVLNKMRQQFGQPIYVVSGYRSPSYNLKVGGAKNSLHMEGLAADLRLPESASDRDRLLRITLSYNFGGRGFYKTFIHVDLRQLLAKPAAYWVG